jgi:CcmD family protein
MARRLMAALAILMALRGAMPVLGQTASQPPRAQEEFVPVPEGAEQEQLPAAPLVIVAYAIAWVVLFLYFWSLWRRLNRVEGELADVSRRLGERRT